MIKKEDKGSDVHLCPLVKKKNNMMSFSPHREEMDSRGAAFSHTVGQT